MSDRELLELAAKAAGFIYKIVDNVLYVQRKRNPKDDWYGWNPLTDDGNALRLAVKLGIHITNSLSEAWASTEKVTAIQIFDQDTDPYAATRRAIVRAAAEIGKGMK